MKKTIMVEGMSCGHCEAAVKEALGELNGVKDVEVNLDSKEVIIDSEKELDSDLITEAIEGIGFEVV